MSAIELFANLDRLEQLGFELRSMVQLKTDFGRWDCNEKITVVVDAGGTIFTRSAPTNEPEILSLLAKICPKGKGYFTSTFVKKFMSSGE